MFHKLHDSWVRSTIQNQSHLKPLNDNEILNHLIGACLQVWKSLLNGAKNKKKSRQIGRKTSDGCQSTLPLCGILAREANLWPTSACRHGDDGIQQGNCYSNKHNKFSVTTKWNMRNNLFSRAISARLSFVRKLSW